MSAPDAAVVSTPIADALLAEYATNPDVSDDTWCVPAHALGEEVAR